jgi:hypothetical protein
MSQSPEAKLPVEPSQPEPSPDAPGRDSRGRFTKGNKGGPGNPFARRMAALRQVLLNTVTDDDIRAVAAELIAHAREGDLAATKLLFAYALGKPTECVDPDTLDAQEWQLFQQAPVTTEGLQAVLGGLPASLACEVARAALPSIEEQLAGQIGQALQPAAMPVEPVVAPAAPPASQSGAEGPSQTEETAATAGKEKPPAARRPSAPRVAKRAPAGPPAPCPQCLGLIGRTCSACGRDEAGAEWQTAPAEAVPEPPSELAALVELLARATDQARRAGAPIPNGVGGG